MAVSYVPDGFGYVCTVTLTLIRYMTLGQCHDTPLRHGQQLCEILSRSKSAVRSYGPDTDLRYVKCNLDMGDMTFNRGHDIALDHGQYVCEILFYMYIQLGSEEL